MKKEKKEKKQTRNKLIMRLLQNKIEKKVNQYKVDVIVRAFNTLNEDFYNEFSVETTLTTTDVIDFLERTKGKLLSVSALEEVKEDKELNE